MRLTKADLAAIEQLVERVVSRHDAMLLERLARAEDAQRATTCRLTELTVELAHNRGELSGVWNDVLGLYEAPYK